VTRSRSNRSALGALNGRFLTVGRTPFSWWAVEDNFVALETTLLRRLFRRLDCSAVAVADGRVAAVKLKASLVGAGLCLLFDDDDDGGLVESCPKG
jgi:hypothetical protein